MSKGPGRRAPMPGKGRIFRRYGIDEDVEREIQLHLESRARELEGEGWSPAEAMAEARRLFGDREAVGGVCKDIARSHERSEERAAVVDMVWQDVRFGFRMLRRNPLFALVATVTLGLGIGANTAVFSIVNGVLLRPLPYEDPQALVWAQEVNAYNGPMSVAWANFTDWQAESGSFSALAAYGSTGATVLGGALPVRAQVTNVSRDFWAVFPLRPVVGHVGGDGAFDPAQPLVAVVSEGFWRGALGGEPLDDLRLEISGRQVQVLGVGPAGFDYPAGTEIWTNLVFLGQSDDRTAHNWNVVGRLAAGVSVEQARQEVDALTKRIVLRSPDATPEYLAEGALVTSLRERVVGEARLPLVLLLGAAGLVFLVACTNLASNLLARGANRSRELAVRVSMGASRGRIVRQLFTESLVLALLGMGGGLLMAVMVLGALHTLGPVSLPRLAEIRMDGPTLGYTAGAALLTGLLFGLFPARRLAGLGVGKSLREGGRGSTGPGGKRVWQGLVGTEVALALVLLVGSGLLVRSFRALLHEDLGLNTEKAASLSMALNFAKYRSFEAEVNWYAELLEALEGDPAVEAAGVLSTLPGSGSLPNGLLELDGDLSKQAQGAYLVASAGAFGALDIPLLEGRLFDDTDGAGAAHVALVSRSFADRYWPGEDPIGKSVSGGGMDNLYRERPFSTVVGVVGDVRYQSPGEEAIPAVYFPYAQRPYRIAYGTGVVMKAAGGDPARLANPVRAILHGLDPDVPLQFRTLDALVGDTVAERRFVMMILGGFSLIALILAGVGIYGVVSFTVAQRTREMGIRLALGADPGSVLRLVMGEALRMVALGFALGVPGALILSRMMASLLYEVSPWDVPTLVVVPLGLLTTALLASWIPARGGTRVDPMVAIRAE